MIAVVKEAGSRSKWVVYVLSSQNSGEVVSKNFAEPRCSDTERISSLGAVTQVISFQGEPSYQIKSSKSTNVNYHTVQSQAVISIGPWGGQGGSEWSCMFSGGLKRILVCYESCIHSLIFQDSSGTFSQKFGTDGGLIGGGRVKEVLIDWPNEYLVSLSGRLGSHGCVGCAVKYLVFQTNARTYSFGVEFHEDSSFSIPIKSGVVVGFHGRSGLLVDSIGLHVAPINPVPQVQAPQIQESKLFAPFRPKRSAP